LDDMAKYAEVKAKKDNVDKLRAKDGADEGKRGVWVGFTFGKAGVSKATQAVLRSTRDDDTGNDNEGPEGLFTIF
jgi:cell cycle protein kinase DBF2